MATIKTAIQLYNGMSPALQSISTAMNMVISSFEAMQNASSRAVDIRSLQAARAELNKAETAFNAIEKEIREADQAQQRLNNDMREGQKAAEGILNKIKGWAAAAGVAFGAKQIIEMSDEMALTKARLDLMNDGLQTTDQLQEMIFESAQRARTSFLDTAQVVSKLGILAGDAFSSNQEMVYFAELMNKQFKIGGASLQEQTAAMYQLTQAMAAGRLQGDEFRSIMENAPMLAQAIEDYMRSAGVEGTIKDWSAQGLITADVIKQAMFSVADETNRRFEELPMTWGQVWTTTLNNILYYSQPLLSFINLLANNWSMIKPIVLGALAALSAFIVANMVYKAITTGTAAIEAIAAARKMMLAGATMSATAAQWGLNAALLASPITWIILAVVALIAVFYAVVAAINKVTGTTYSATGMITGAIAAALAFINNVFTAFFNFVIDIISIIWNHIAVFAEFFANVFNDPVGSIVRLFAGMADAVLGIIESIARAIDTVFGSNLAAAVNGWRSGLNSKVTDLVGEAKVKVMRADPSAMYLERMSIRDAYDAGYKWGAKREDQVKAMMDNLIGIYNGVSDTAANTGKMADAMEITEEDLKYLRDVAEREVIDRTVLRDIKVTLTNTFGDIRETADIDGIINKLETRLAEAIAIEAEGGSYV